MTREIESFALADGKDRWGACVAVAYETELKEGLPGTHPLCTSHILTDLHALHALQLLSGSHVDAVIRSANQFPHSRSKS